MRASFVSNKSSRSWPQNHLRHRSQERRAETPFLDRGLVVFFALWRPFPPALRRQNSYTASGVEAAVGYDRLQGPLLSSGVRFPRSTNASPIRLCATYDGVGHGCPARRKAMTQRAAGTSSAVKTWVRPLALCRDGRAIASAPSCDILPLRRALGATEHRPDAANTSPKSTGQIVTSALHFFVHLPQSLRREVGPA